MDRDQILENLVETIGNLSDYELIDLNNEYCEQVNYPDDRIYTMDTLNDLLAGMEAYEVLRLAHYGNFSPHDDYFRFDGYGNLESSPYVEDIMLDRFDIAEYILDNENDLENDSIADFLAELEEIDEE